MKLFLLFPTFLFSLCVLGQPGTNDFTFNTFDDGSQGTGSGFNGEVYAIEQLNDGSIIAVGNFTEYSGISQNRIAVIHSNGLLDNSFDSGFGFKI